MSIAIKAIGPAFFQWRPGATPRLKPSGPPSRFARHPPGAAGLLADDGDSAVGHETQALVAWLNAGQTALISRKRYLSLGADFGHDLLQ